MIDLFEACEAEFEEVGYEEFYRDIFPEGSFEKAGEYTEGGYNGIAVTVERNGGKGTVKRYTVTDDLERIDELVATDAFCIMAPIAYAGKSRTATNARFLYAMAIDLDGVETLEQWDFFLHQIYEGEKFHGMVSGLPKPTYVVASGTGLHLYYAFEEAVPLFKNIVKQLEKLKKRLTWQAWTQGASSLHERVQYESLFQGFRMVGSITKKGDRARAFKVGEKVTIEYLNRYVPEAYRTTDFTYKSELRLEKAKELYPEWYERRVVKKAPRGTWVCKRALYDWWLSRAGEAMQGHRYWYVMTLVTYAKKCRIPYEEVRDDAYALIPYLNRKGDAFTEEDVEKALEAYKDSYVTYPIKAIEERTALKIERNRRNGRTREEHLKIARFVRDMKGQDWRDGNGRKPKAEVVREWRRLHPNGKKEDCHRDTGMSRDTIRKWWDEGSQGAVR